VVDATATAELLQCRICKKFQEVKIKGKKKKQDRIFHYNYNYLSERKISNME
jgi:hypothetical protein